MIEAQLQAAWVVLEVLGGRSLTPVLTQARSPEPDPSWGMVQDIAFGVFRHLGLLRGVLSTLVTRPLTDPDVEALLLVAMYQLQFTHAAPYAVVDHAVQATGRLRKASAKGLVNAVLRTFLRKREALISQARQTEEGRWSYPRWWIDEIKRAYPDRYDAVLSAGNAHPPMTLRVNLRRIARDEYAELLRGRGYEVEAVGLAALQMERPAGVEELPGFQDGLASVQDLAAQYAAPLLDLEAGQRVLDACAAPGGKAAHILEHEDVQLTAIERDTQRIGRLRETLGRLRLSARLVCGDAAEPSTWWDGVPFQRILLDAPCTASGIVRRHPDIKWLRRAEDTGTFALQQRRLLGALWRTLAAGGKLLYATCSVFPAENQLQVSAFLQSHPEATLLPLSGIPEGLESANNAGQILPDPRHDGFFYALLQKA